MAGQILLNLVSTEFKSFAVIVLEDYSFNKGLLPALLLCGGELSASSKSLR